MKGIILHGGHGTRLRPLTHTGPKQLLPIANKPMSQYCLESVKESGITEIAMIIGGLGSNKVREYYGTGKKFGVNITYIEQDEPRGIAHAIRLCKEFVNDEKFLVFLGDNIIQKSIKDFVENFNKSDYDATVLLCEVDNKNQDYLNNIDVGINGKKIGIVTEMTNPDGLSTDVLDATNDAIKTFENLGANCEQISLEMVRYAVAAYYTITSTEAGSNLARYDNIRYGYELDSSGFEFNSYISQARSKFGPEVIRRMILGGFVPSAGHAGKYFSKALKVKSKLITEINHVFEKFDYLISPTVPIQPFKFGEKINDPVSFMMVDFNTVTANLTGIPAISVPYKITNGLPIGIQIMANRLEEHSLLQAAYALEKTVDLPEVPI